ncbi:unnamed protein product [Adineta steineri]|uniref:EGF-like domain-containing protein n=1 Tax=Adineta steineri TaxID=433720 RepID=A0A815PGK0_9BILA|nr:unnamed protein product [Adineta steineri]CAF1629862.1 unnamed protein product [Adineta steineri]
MSNTNGGEFDHVLLGYDFDIELFEEEIPLNVCEPHYIPQRVAALQNSSGYFYCTSYDKGIKQMCPPGTEVSLKIGGCVNKTTNTSVFPTGSRCAAQPCQNGGVCFDFSSADAYLCHCPLPYEGLHCHLLQNYCFNSGCGGTIGNMSTECYPYTNNMALQHSCRCHDWSTRPFVISFAGKNCYTEKLFVPKCEGEPPVGAVPFTNKGFYICLYNRTRLFIKSCPLQHVWNDTKKECVLENN